MQQTPLPVCTNCHKEVLLSGAAFCPHCGAPLAQAQASQTPPGARTLLEQAEKLSDPRKKHEVLSEAMRAYPDCLEVAKALLFLGRLHERDPRKLDFSVIKCHLLHGYLTPEEFTPEERDAMRRELFSHPDLDRCLALAPDADVFMQQYLTQLCGEFIRIFLKGSSRYAPSILGFRIERNTAKQLAFPTANMLAAIHHDTALDPEQSAMLYNALYTAFSREMGGETQWLDEQLAARQLSAPAAP